MVINLKKKTCQFYWFLYHSSVVWVMLQCFLKEAFPVQHDQRILLSMSLCVGLAYQPCNAHLPFSSFQFSTRSFIIVTGTLTTGGFSMATSIYLENHKKGNLKSSAFMMLQIQYLLYSWQQNDWIPLNFSHLILC